MGDELKERLLRHLRFLEDEFVDFPRFAALTQAEYASNRDMRRNVERWVENIINSSIDIAKIIVTAESLPLPDSYRQTLTLLKSVTRVRFGDSERLADWVRLRNILAHEYVDVRWRSIRRFITECEPLYRDFLRSARRYLAEALDDTQTGR